MNGVERLKLKVSVLGKSLKKETVNPPAGSTYTTEMREESNKFKRDVC